MKTAVRPDAVMVKGEGSWLEDSTGRRYLDFVQGWAVNCLGHTPIEIRNAIHAQVDRLINPSPAFYNDQMIQLADLVAKTSGLDSVFFCNSGAEANEGAIKLARKWGRINKNGAHRFITFENGFHGRTLATMSASGKPQWDQLFEPKVPGFTKVPFNNLLAVESAITDDTVAIMLEPIQGEGGVIPASHEFMMGLRKLSTQHQCLLIVDEVQSGIGRTGSVYAFSEYGIQPDILTLGKGIGGGVPLAALVSTAQASVFEPGDQGGTYNGNPLMAAAGVAVFETILSPGFLDTVRLTASYLTDQLTQLSDAHGLRGTRGTGLLQALLLPDDRGADVVARALELGLLINSPRPNAIRFMPSLRVSRSEIDEMIDRLNQCL